MSADLSTIIAPSNLAQYDLAFQISPIMLQGGIAASAQGGILPIVALYGQLGAYTDGAITDPNEFFARYMPLPGSTLISFTVGTYPFANQQVAANAVIQQPLTLSMLMICPVNQPGGYLTKLPTLTALRGSLVSHINSGGTFSIATPAYVYNNLLMTGMSDITNNDGHQRQVEWQLDFVAPLITLSDAAAAQSSLMQRATNGGQMPNPPPLSGPLQGASQQTGGMTGALQTFGGSFGSGT
jgi:hypothetical protein